MKKNLLLPLVYIVTILLPARAQEHKALKEIFSALDSISQAHPNQANPFWIIDSEGNSSWGHPKTYTFNRMDALREETAQKKAYVKKLGEIPASALSQEEYINKEIRLLQLKDEQAYVHFKRFLVPLDAETGFYSQPTFFFPIFPFAITRTI
ncbi:MAG: hypothetical protein AAFU64_06605 [Bacteroidota bacterium]